MMNERLQQQGWETITHFAQKSGIPYTVETVRRAFTDCGKHLSADTLAIVLRYLNYSRQEIRQILQTYTDDKEIIKLIGIGDDNHTELTADQQAWLDIYDKLVKKDPASVAHLAQLMGWVASLIGVEISKETGLISRKKGS